MGIKKTVTRTFKRASKVGYAEERSASNHPPDALPIVSTSYELACAGNKLKLGLLPVDYEKLHNIYK